MSLRASKHIFTGSTTPINSYDSSKTSIGSLIVQNTGPNPEDKYIGPVPNGIARPMQEVVHTGNVATVSATVVTGSGTSFTSSMTGMLIGFGSTNPAKVTTWYTLGAWTSATVIAITSGPTIGTTTPFVIVSNIPCMYPHAITYSSTIDWVFMIENSTAASASRKVMMYEFNKTTSTYTWIGFINLTLPTSTAHTIRGFRALRYIHNTGTVSVSDNTVVGVGTSFTNFQGSSSIMRIGFGTTDPTAVSTWYTIFDFTSNTNIVLDASLSFPPGTPYVVEELGFALVTTNATVTNGGLFLAKGISLQQFTKTGTTIPAATSSMGMTAVYWLSDAGTTANVVTNIAACGLTIQPEVNKGLHYAYIPDGVGSSYMKVYRYNLRATGTVAAGKMTMSVAYTTSGTVTVASGVVTASGTPFTSAMVGMKIGFGSTSPALITTWYTIGTYTSTSSVTLTNLTVNVGAGSSYIVDSADVLCTGNELVAGTVVGVNNGRIGTLNHGPGAGVESLYFVTSTRIYRADLSKIYAGNLDWISDNRPEIPPGSVSTFPATSALNAIEIADAIDRLIVLTTGATGFRNYVTKYPTMAGDAFDHIWGMDNKQQDQILAGGSAYITSGTVQVSTTTVTGTNTFFTAAMVGFRIGFGTTDPTAVSTWYTISAWTSSTSITLSSSAGSIGGGSSYVIDWNSKTAIHFNTASQVTSVWSQNGIAHIIKHGVTSALNQMYSLPFGAHWTYAESTKQRVITPVIYTPDCAGFQRVVVINKDRIGSGEFSVLLEPFRVYYRTKGIYDNTGSWTLAVKDGDLTGLGAYPRIQLMLEFPTIGWFCAPSRITSLTVIYSDTATTTDSHYQPSVAKSDSANKRFAWRFSTAFGGTVPTLRVRIYNALTGDLLIDDYTVNSKGTWNKLTDGGNTWGSYNTSDKGNETTYISYTPASLGDNIKVRIVLTQ